jgi:hypothetical protein
MPAYRGNPRLHLSGRCFGPTLQAPPPCITNCLYFLLDDYKPLVYIGDMSFGHTLIVKITKELNAAIQAAANRLMMSKSAWVRHALMEKLERDLK